MGDRLANTLFTPIVDEYLELSTNLGISKMKVPDRLIGFTLTEAGFENKPGSQKLTVVSIKRGDSLVMYPAADEILSENDELCIIGNNNSINKLL
jgi:Trk K+ transport system NAD-binding subunit